MTNIYELFKDHIEMPDILVGVAWYLSDYSIHWNLDGNVDDLFNGDGDTYSAEIYGQGIVVDGYVMYLMDNCCGDRYQAIFKLSNKKDENEYWSSKEEE